MFDYRNGAVIKTIKMPNYIKNQLKFIGSEELIEGIFEKYSTHFPKEINKSYDGRIICRSKSGEVGWFNEETNEFERRENKIVIGLPYGFEYDHNEAWTRFPDFGKITPCPSVIAEVGEIHSGVIDHVKNKYNVRPNGNAFLALLESQNRLNLKPLKEEDLPVFERACRAYEETGFIYWYEWNLENWGTKWNAYECEKTASNIYTFVTAWSGVPDLLQKISLENPFVTIEYKYSDEDTGFNVGEYTYLNGVISKILFEGGSKEAYELAFELRPESKEYYEFVDGNYQYKDED